MVATELVLWMGERTFRDEEARRHQLRVYRAAAARWGIRGPVHFRRVGIHGRTTGYIAVHFKVAT